MAGDGRLWTQEETIREPPRRLRQHRPLISDFPAEQEVKPNLLLKAAVSQDEVWEKHMKTHFRVVTELTPSQELGKGKQTETVEEREPGMTNSQRGLGVRQKPSSHTSEEGPWGTVNSV